MKSLAKVLAIVLSLWVTHSAVAQDHSIRPGVNEKFKEPDVPHWVTEFESSKRETYELRKQIVAACRLKPAMAVADIGAGTGLYSLLFASEVGPKGKVYATDISPGFLNYINQQAKSEGIKNIKTFLGTDVTTGLPRESVDVAFVCDTYHHFEFPQRMLKSVRDSLKQGGELIIVDFRKGHHHSDWVEAHVRADQAAVEGEVIAAGFEKVRESEGVLKENYLLVFRRK